MTWLYTPYNSLSPDLSLLNKKVQIDRATQASWRWSLYKQATQTHVPNS